jgi:hypothetical protein
MEELQTQELEELVEELEGEGGADEALSPEVEELLRILQSGGAAPERRDSAEQLGKVTMSSPRIVRALVAAYESDPSSMVNRAAAKSLRAPVHQEYLQEHPDLMEAAEKALQMRPGADRQRPPRISPGPNSDPSLEEVLLWAGEAADHPAGLAIGGAGLILGLVRKLRNPSDRALQERPGVVRQGPRSRPGNRPSDGEAQSLSYHSGAALGSLFVRIRRSLTKRPAPADPGEPKGLGPHAPGQASLVREGDQASDCPVCGAWNAAGSEICGECGVAQEGAAA